MVSFIVNDFAGTPHAREHTHETHTRNCCAVDQYLRIHIGLFCNVLLQANPVFRTRYFRACSSFWAACIGLLGFLADYSVLSEG